MAEDTVDLDGRRGMAAPKAAGMRRQLAGVEGAAPRARQEDLEHDLIAASAAGWGEAMAKAGYHLALFAPTSAAENPRRVRLIGDVLDAFERRLAEPKHPPVAGDAGLAPARPI